MQVKQKCELIHYFPLVVRHLLVRRASVCIKVLGKTNVITLKFLLPSPYHEFYCRIWCHGITLGSLGQFSWICFLPPCCAIPTFLLGEESQKTLMLYKTCPAIAKTLLCYPCWFNPKGKSPHRLWQRNSPVKLHPSQIQLHHCYRTCRFSSGSCLCNSAVSPIFHCDSFPYHCSH